VFILISNILFSLSVFKKIHFRNFSYLIYFLNNLSIRFVKVYINEHNIYIFYLFFLHVNIKKLSFLI